MKFQQFNFIGNSSNWFLHFPNLVKYECVWLCLFRHNVDFLRIWLRWISTNFWFSLLISNIYITFASFEMKWLEICCLVEFLFALCISRQDNFFFFLKKPFNSMTVLDDSKNFRLKIDWFWFLVCAGRFPINRILSHRLIKPKQWTEKFTQKLISHLIEIKNETFHFLILCFQSLSFQVRNVYRPAHQCCVNVVAANGFSDGNQPTNTDDEYLSKSWWLNPFQNCFNRVSTIRNIIT